jgi:hypothetical protein
MTEETKFKISNNAHELIGKHELKKKSRKIFAGLKLAKKICSDKN